MALAVVRVPSVCHPRDAHAASMGLLVPAARVLPASDSFRQCDVWQLVMGRRSHMLETRPLLIFKTIAEVGSFTRAGVRLGLSQPAISQHIRALEREVGAPLLVRLGKSAKPTPQGEMLLHYARHVLGKIEEVERLLAEAADGRTGVLRIG